MIGNAEQRDWKQLRRQRGRFYLSLNRLEENLILIQRIMSNVIVLNCEGNFADRNLKYDAISHLFTEMDEGQRPPLYQFGFDDFNDLSCKQVDENYKFYSEVVSGCL